MTTTTHTPTPWKVYAGGRGAPVINDSVINDSNGFQIALLTACEQSAANAAHIVRCVNAHDALTSRVAELEKHLSAVLECDIPITYLSDAVFADARAALAKVQQ